MWFGLGKTNGDGLASIQKDMALQGLRGAGLSRQAAALVVDAGYSSAAALRKAPWSAAEAGGLHQSAEWRLSTTPGSSAALISEVLSFRGDAPPPQVQTTSPVADATQGEPTPSTEPTPDLRPQAPAQSA
jgi:hypothetical protein